MKRYSIFHAFVLSFFSRDLYKDVAHHWRGVGFLYLLLLLTICWVPTCIKVGADFSKFANDEAPGVLEQVPNITIANGEVSISEPMPYTIKNPKTDETLAIIDTTGQTTVESSNVPVLLTKTSLMIRRTNRSESRLYNLSGVQQFSLTKEWLYSWLGLAKTFLPIIVFPFMLLGSYVYRILQALLYAAIGLIFVSVLKAGLTYSALLRLSVIAVTPVLILDTIRSLTGPTIPFWWLICFLIAMGYLYFGVKSSTVQSAVPPEVFSAASSG
jgi:hypothetical protein